MKKDIEVKDYIEKPIFEYSSEGRVGYSIRESELQDEFLPDESLIRDEVEGLPEVSEVDVVRHYTKLSQLNYAVDIGFYPLGSCTMKYNPKINEKIASSESFTLSHPYMPEELVQGNLRIMKELENLLSHITGMDYFSLSPSAGAHGELTGVMIIRKRLEDRGDPRKIVLIPDSAHGTNPASSHFAGYEVKEIPSGENGYLEAKTVKEYLNPDVAALMVTNPNTLGIFEKEIKEIAELLHENGSYLYMDGANLNALMGYVKPAELGVDVIHLNLHKTFSTPHGGGGPGAGPVGVTKELEPYLPVPVIKEKDGILKFDYNRPKSIGRVRAFYGNFGVIIKALAYILELSADGLKRATELAVLNSNYIRKNLEDTYHLKYKTPTLHECVFSEKSFKQYKVKTVDIAKRLLDYGFHPPTVYFPLIVKGALMIEPTETESIETLDSFISAMKKIHEEAEKNPDILKSAPHKTPVRRLNEVYAAKNLKLTYKKEV